MKKFILPVLLLSIWIVSGSVHAQDQKIGFFESDLILSKLPEYAGVEQRLQLISDGWKQEITDMETEINDLEEDYKAKEILYTEEIRAEKQREIQQKKKAKDAFLNQKFGPNGEYFQSQDELLEPIMRQVFTAVREVATKQGFDFVFDRSGDIYMVFARNEWSLNEAILLELGIEVE